VAQADTILALADAGNAALPTLNENEDDLVALLEQASRLSSDVADLLEANEPFVRASMVEGSRTIQLLYDERTQVIPLVHGLRQYVQTLTSVIRIPSPAGDGTLLAAVKGLLGGDACELVPCAGVDASSSASAGSPPTATAPRPPGPLQEVLPDLDRGPGANESEGANSVSGILEKVLLG
jgi:ABC-type transporter Mla subunit MlaD